MADQHVVFDNTVDALFRRALGGRMTDRCRSRICEAGIDLASKLKPSYPRDLYYRCVHIAAEELFRELPTSEAMFKLGEAFILGFEQTLLGRTVLSVVRMLGPKRTLARMTQNMRSSNNYLETRLTEVTAGSHELWLSETSGVPDYFRGVIATAIPYSKAANVRVALKESDGHSCTLLVSWDEAK